MKFERKQPAPQEQTIRPLSAHPDSAAEEMLRTIEILHGVYSEETQALESSDIKRFMALQDNKIEVASLYHDGMRQMLERKNELRAINPALKSKLEDAQKKFSELTQRNLQALDRMNRTTERLGETILSAVKREAQQRNTVNYGEGGTLHHVEKRRISMGLNENA